MANNPKRVIWIAGSREALRSFPEQVTVKFAGFVYVLHCFQKKSRRGAETPRRDLGLIQSRLRLAERDYEARKGGR